MLRRGGFRAVALGRPGVCTGPDWAVVGGQVGVLWLPWPCLPAPQAHTGMAGSMQVQAGAHCLQSSPLGLQFLHSSRRAWIH